jgi:hypothetical protein
MKEILTAMVIVALMSVAMPSAAHAGLSRQATGGLMLLGGTTMIFGAFNWSASCPSGYTTHRFEGLETQCVYIDRYGSDVRGEDVNVEMGREWMLPAGIGTAIGGLVLMTLPKKAKKVAPSISLTPGGWKATKTVTF